MKSNDKTLLNRGARKKKPSAQPTTQLEALQTKIQETEDRFQIIFDNSPDGMVIINPTENAEGPWLIENCNRSFCEMNGFDRSELIGKDIRIVSNETAAEVELLNKYHEKINGEPDNGKTHRRAYYQRLKQGPIRIEEIHTRKDGSTFYIQASSCLITLSGQERVLSIDRDITERKRNEEQFLLLSKFPAENPNPVMRIARDGVLDFANKSSEPLLAMWNIGIGQAMPKEWQTWNAEVFGSRQNKEVEIKCGERVFSCTLVPIMDAGYLNVFGRDITELKHAEEALRMSERRFRELQENVELIAVMINAEGRITFCNDYLLRLVGRSRADVLGQDWFAMFVPPELQVDDAFRTALLHGTIPAHFENEILTASGERRLISWNNIILLDAEGSVIGTNSLGEDITERKKAEEALLSSQQIIEGIINLIPVRVFWKNKNLDYLGCNTIFAGDAGFADPKDIIGKDDYQMVWRDQAELYRSDDRQVIESGSSKLFIEEPQTTPEGNTITLLTSKIPLRSSGGEINGILGTYIDITERKQAEQALRESEARFSTVFHSSPTSISITSLRDNRYIDVNTAWEQATGYSREEALGHTPVGMNAWVIPSERERMMEILKKHGRVDGFESQIRRKPGNIAEFLMSAEIIEIAGEPCNLTSALDITERKRAEETLRESEARYQSLFKDSPTALWLEDYSAVKQKINHLQKRDVKNLRNYFSRYPESIAQWAALVKVVDVNQAALDLHQAGSKEELLTGLNTIFIDEASPILIEEIIALSEGKLRFEGEFIEQTLKGARINVAVILSVPPGCEETWSKVLVSTIDITERKQAELALHESEEKFRNLFNNAEVGMFRTRLDGSEILDINEKFLGILGRRRAEMQGSASVFHWANATERVELVRRLEAEDRVIDFECRMLNKQGEVRRCLMSMQLYRAQGILEGSILDITERKRHELIQNAIYRITQTAITSEGTDALYQSIHSILGELIPAENFFIALYDSAHELLSFPYFIDQYDEPPPAPTQVQGLTGYIIRTGRSLLATPEDFDRLVQQGEVEPVGAAGLDWLGVPLKVEGRIIGVMAVQSYTEGIHFDQEDMTFLEFVSTQVALAIERKRLEEEIRSLSLTDELTGLFNRRGFTLLAEQELKLAHRKNRTMLLFFCDVDNLKTINDTLGHAHGDLALKEVSVILKKTFREADILARVGGDEFVVLALDASVESAELLTNRIQAALEARNQQGDTTYLLSLSLGIARYDPEAPCTVSELIVQADGLMYHQKQARKGKK